MKLSTNRTAKMLFILSVMFMLLFFRNSRIFIYPEPIVEDFGVFLGQEYIYGFQNSVFKLYAGYIHLLPRIIAWISMQFDMSLVMIVMNWTVLFIKILIFYLIYSSKEINSNIIKISLLAYLILLPFPGEVYNNITNLQWWLIPLMAIIMIKRDTSTIGLLFSSLILILTGLTGINSILFAIPCVYLTYKIRTTECLIKTALIVICAMIQFYCFYTSPRIGKLIYNGGGIDIINLFVNRVIYRTLFSIHFKSYLNIIIFIIYIFILTFNLYYYRKQVNIIFIFLFSAIYSASILYYCLRRPNLDVFDNYQANERYFIFLRICTFILLVSSLNILFKNFSHRNYKRMIVYSLFLFSLILLKSYPVNYPFSFKWYDDIQKFESAKKGELVKFHYVGARGGCEVYKVWICDIKKK